MKSTRKKIAYLGGEDKNNSNGTKKYERKIRTAIKGIKKLVFTQHGQESAQLFTEAGPRNAGLEPASRFRQTRDHAAGRQDCLLYVNSDYQNERKKT